MGDEFKRTAALIGSDNIARLGNRRVAVFGVGGVGGHAAEALCRSGVGCIDVFDGDIVDVTNINRQLIATHETVGLDKVEVMRRRLRAINPRVVATAHKIFYLPENADDVDLSVYDYVIDAIDTMTAKLELVCRCTSLEVPIVSAMGAANKLDPTAFEVADIFSTSVCPMARVMRKELRMRGVDALKVVYSREIPFKAAEKQSSVTSGAVETTNTETVSDESLSEYRPPPASISFVPPVAGLILAGEVIKDLIK